MTPEPSSASSLYLTIPSGAEETAYRVEFLHPAPAVKVGWRLTKENGETYDVALTEFGYVCGCSDFLWRRDGKDEAGCKHCIALRSLGLFGRRGLPRVET